MSSVIRPTLAAPCWRTHWAASLAAVVVLPTPVAPIRATTPPSSHRPLPGVAVRRLRVSVSITQRTAWLAPVSAGMRSSTARAIAGE